MLSKTYSMEVDSPPAMETREYQTAVEKAWEVLLDGSPAELEVQDFLERHPAMVPGAFGVGSPSGHAPFPGALISQPELYGYRARRPDFLWFSKNSLNLNPILIEIEAPRKKLFTAQGQQTAEFTQARNQILEWKSWLSRHDNQERFLRDYGVDFPNVKCEPHFVLIYGRRSEFAGNERLALLRAELAGENEHLMTYDRLWFEPKAADLPSVRHTTRGYEVLHLPPTYGLGPCMFDYDEPLLGRLEAVERNPMISEARKAFMRRRLPYWEHWGRDPKGIYSTGDAE